MARMSSTRNLISISLLEAIHKNGSSLSALGFQHSPIGCLTWHLPTTNDQGPTTISQLPPPHTDDAKTEHRTPKTVPQLNVGSFTRSSRGTDSTGCPAFLHAARPPTRMNALNPFSRSMCATRALVASRCQVQYR